MSAHGAVKNRDNAMTDQTIPIMLNDLFGIEAESFQCYQPPSREKNTVRFGDGASVPVNVFADVLKVNESAVIGTWDRDYMKGRAACTENKAGKGKAVYYGSFFSLESARYLLRRYAAEQQLKPLLTGVPQEVEVTRRTKGSANYYFILNHAVEAVTVSPGRGYFDLLVGKVSPASFTLGPFEYRVLRK